MSGYHRLTTKFSNFSSHNIITNPSSLAANIGYEAGYIADRCLMLTRYGIVEQLDGPKYRLTELGEQFVAGNVGEDELELVDEE